MILLLEIRLLLTIDYDFVIDSGDVARVDGQLAVSRAFGDKSLKKHLSSDPYVTVEMIDDGAEFLILASDGLWKVRFHKLGTSPDFWVVFSPLLTNIHAGCTHAIFIFMATIFLHTKLATKSIVMQLKI